MTTFRAPKLPSFFAVLAAVAALFCGEARAATPPCPDDGGALPRNCTKEIRIYNNTSGRLWVVLQASIQLTDALNCPVTPQPGSGGDVWLQAALGRTNDCFAVRSDYYAFINRSAGIPKGGFVSIKVPWWSKRRKTADPDSDRYIDWWRGARVIMFDDRTALNEAYEKVKNNLVAFTAGSPKPRCNNNMAGNACNGLRILEVKGGQGIATHVPSQLNEYTFADVSQVTDNGTKGGEFLGFDQNYNVSNVDQVYLPVALEPVRKPADVGYLGTTMSVKQFRKQLTAFTNADNPNNLLWPIYNNPTKKNGRKTYPKAGIRVPSAQSALIYYMSPFDFPDGKTPAILPKKPPKLVRNMLDQWKDCTRPNPQSCNQKQSRYYEAVNKVFLDNYKSYWDRCKDNTNVPKFMKPVNNNPLKPKPKLTTFLAFIYGWVPFNVVCGNKELPTPNDPPPGSRSIIDYTHQMQYNYEDLPGKRAQWFNPYTRLIHAKVKDGGLAASAYAFSIDDAVSFLKNDGGSLPGGLIFAVGGPKGLVNGKQHAPPVPPLYKWYTFSIGLGDPRPQGRPSWKKYGICSNTADTPFPTEDKGGFTIGIDPALTKINKRNPCLITLQDASNRKYQLKILKATPPGIKLPQEPIWPKFTPSGVHHHDPNVVRCPTKPGFVPPAQWCNGANEVSTPSNNPNMEGFYTISAPEPVPN